MPRTGWRIIEGKFYKKPTVINDSSLKPSIDANLYYN